MSTNIGFKEELYEGRGKGFSWWEEKYRMILNVIYTKDLEIDLEKHYSSSEIEQLVKEKKIVIVDRNFESVNDIENEEPLISLESCEIFDEFGNLDLDLNKKTKYYEPVLHYIRDNVNVDKIKRGVLKYLNTLKDFVNLALKESQNHKYKNRSLADMSTKTLEEMDYKGKMLKFLNSTKQKS